MSRALRVTFIGAVCVVLFDIVASFLSLWLGVEYGWAVIGSWLLYAAVGYAAVRTEQKGSGLRAGAVIGFVDATCGWAASSVIGPGQVPGVSPGMITVTVVIVTVSAGLLGALGGFVAKVGYPSERRAV